MGGSPRTPGHRQLWSPSCTCRRSLYALRPWALRAQPEKGLHGWILRDEKLQGRSVSPSLLSGMALCGLGRPSEGGVQAWFPLGWGSALVIWSKELSGFSSSERSMVSIRKTGKQEAVGDLKQNWGGANADLPSDPGLLRWV